MLLEGEDVVVPKIALSPTLLVSRIVTGLWQVADLERPGGLGLSIDDAVADLRKADGHGLTTFDMADHYGTAEELMARCPGLQSLTKWVPKPGREHATAEAVDAAVRKSLSRMGRETLDLLQFHTWDYLDGPGVWLEQMELLATHPSVANLGVTNFDTAHLQLGLASGLPIGAMPRPPNSASTSHGAALNRPPSCTTEPKGLTTTNAPTVWPLSSTTEAVPSPPLRVPVSAPLPAPAVPMAKSDAALLSAASPSAR